MISDALFLAERPNGLAAGILLGDQLAPILALLVRHPPRVPHLQPATEGWITRRLQAKTNFNKHGVDFGRAATVFLDPLALTEKTRRTVT